MKRTALSLLAGILALALPRCAGDPVAGSGTQTTNGLCVEVAGNVLYGYIFTRDIDGSETRSGPRTVRIELRAAAYKPYDHVGFSAAYTPDSTGGFTSGVLADGLYNILAFDTASGAGTAILQVYAGQGAGPFTRRNTFASLGSIGGRVVRGSIDTLPMGVYIPGSPWFALTDTAGTFLLGNVPAETYGVCADYFQATRSPGVYYRIAGKYTHSDTLTVLTDTATVHLAEGEMVFNVNLTLK